MANAHRKSGPGQMSDANDEERKAEGEKPVAETKPKRRYFCEGTGVEIGHKARFAGMGFDAQLKSRLVNAALEGKDGVRYSNETGEPTTKPAIEHLSDLGWLKFYESAKESRDTKAKAKADRLAAASAAAAEKAGSATK